MQRGCIELLATDVSEAALVTAQRAQRSRRALRQLPRGIDVERWFSVQDEHVSLRSDLQRSIRWQALNLLDDAAVARVAAVDVVLCRNVTVQPAASFRLG
jgi:chemotaxis methyl-accepting protein methylase